MNLNPFRNYKPAFYLSLFIFIAPLPQGATLYAQESLEGEAAETEEEGEKSIDYGAVPMELILYAYPFNSIHGGRYPSMAQALSITKTFSYAGNTLIGQYLFKGKTNLKSVYSRLAFDILTVWMPGGTSWLHEEWHRAVLSQYGIDSYNEIYDFPLFASTMKVKHVKESDLSWLKKNHPADMVRLSSAGMEADTELVAAISKDIFFHQPSKNMISLFPMYINTLNVIFYRHSCTSQDSETITKELLEKEGSDENERDFTGMDCNAWVYDMFRPEEPYEARGPHPSGTGTDRYIVPSDLTAEEKQVLKNQLYLSLLNVVNPMMWGKPWFQLETPQMYPLYWNFALLHHTTPFGHDLRADIYLFQGYKQLVISLHSYRSRNLYLPGLEVELYRYPFYIGLKPIYLTLKAGIWKQPKNLLYGASQGETGGKASAMLRYSITPALEIFVQGEYKTTGWVAGTTWLHDQASGAFGLTWFLWE